MKKILIGLILLMWINSSSAIGYFKIKFSTQLEGIRTEYTGLLLYYDDNSDLNTMRIYFYNQMGERILVEEKIKIEYDDRLGNDFRVFRGYHPRILIDGIQAKASYFPDVFKFKKAQNGYFEPDHVESTIDSVGLQKGKITLFQSVKNISAKELREFGLDKSYSLQDHNFKSDRVIAKGPAVRDFNIRYEAPDTVEEKAPLNKIHLIVMSNTLVEDLSGSIKINEAGIERFMGSLIEQAGNSVNQIEIDGKDFTLATMNGKIKNLTVAENDGIIFYYSGHGFRTTDQLDSFPYLDIRYNTLVQRINANNSRNLKDIYEELKAKKPAFCIVIGECCNDTTDNGLTTGDLLKNIPKPSLKPAKASLDPIREDLARNLLTFRGSLLVSTAHPYQRSYYDSDKGGVFWYFFRNIMFQNLVGAQSPTSTSWIDYLSYAAKQTETTVKASDVTFIQIPLWLSAQ
jgi:hypothetical protein